MQTVISTPTEAQYVNLRDELWVQDERGWWGWHKVVQISVTEDGYYLFWLEGVADGFRYLVEDDVVRVRREVE